VWSEVSHNFSPSPHYSLFVTSIFILVHMYTIESLIRGQLKSDFQDQFPKSLVGHVQSAPIDAHENEL